MRCSTLFPYYYVALSKEVALSVAHSPLTFRNTKSRPLGVLAPQIFIVSG